MIATIPNLWLAIGGIVMASGLAIWIVISTFGKKILNRIHRIVSKRDAS